MTVESDLATAVDAVVAADAAATLTDAQRIAIRVEAKRLSRAAAQPVG